MLTEQQTQALQLLLILLILRRVRRRKRIGRRPDTDSKLTGFEYVDEIIRGNPTHAEEMLRMKKHIFVKLCTHFRNKGWVTDSRYICVEEKIALFVMTLGQHFSYRVCKRRFQHSTQTVHRYFYEVLSAMMLFAKEMIVPNYDSNANISRRQQRIREAFKVLFHLLIIIRN